MNSVLSDTSNTSRAPALVQWVSKSPRLRGITTSAGGYTIVGASVAVSGPVNQSGVVADSDGSTRTLLKRAITCALAVLSTNVPYTAVLPGLPMARSFRVNEPKPLSTMNEVSSVTSRVVPSGNASVAV